MRLYEIDGNKIVKEAKRKALAAGLIDESVISLVIAPLALISHNGKYYLTTKHLSPREVVDSGYVYGGPTTQVVLHLHVLWAEDSGVKISQMPQIKWLTTPREILAEYSRELPVQAWIEDNTVRLAWAKFFNGLDK